jgi:hypothetical protein
MASPSPARVRGFLLAGRTGRPGQLTNCSIDVWFAPKLRSAVIEDVEVVCVVPFLLDYLQLNVGVIQSLVVGFGAGIGEGESSAGEEVRNLFGPEPVGVIEFGLGAFVLGQGVIIVLAAAFTHRAWVFALGYGQACLLGSPLRGQRAVHLGRCCAEDLASLVGICLVEELTEVVRLTSGKGGGYVGRDRWAHLKRSFGSLLS